jgi:hypothetical protein
MSTDIKLKISQPVIKFNFQGVPAPVVAQVQTDWNATAGLGVLLHKPSTFPPSSHNHALNDLSEKSYNSLSDKPSIPAAQVQTDWNATEGLGKLLNKPSTFPPSSHNHALNDLSEKSYSSLTDKPSIPAAQIQSDWNQGTTEALDFIKNKPSIPAAQVQADWNAVSGMGQILNKPNVTYKTLAADHDNGSPNPAAMTTAFSSDALLPNKNYFYFFRILHRTNAYTTGMGFSITFSSTPSAFTINQLTTAANSATYGFYRIRTEDAVLVSSQLGTSAGDDHQPYESFVFGWLLTNAATVINLRCKSELNSTKVEVLKGTKLTLELLD